MSRTPLFAAVKKALAAASLDQGIVWPRSSALSRRQLLRLSAAAAGAAAFAPTLDWSAYAKEKKSKGQKPSSVAIIGGGVAGLTAAYRLQQAGAKPVLFEASNRWGGRMFTRYDFYKGMFCELGGEFVDTDHEDLQKLGAEHGVEMQKLATEGEGEDLYFFKGQFHTPKEMIDPAKKTGAFAPIAKQIAKDAGKLTDRNDNWTKHATRLDQTSLKDYLERFRGKTDDWAIDLLDVAYNIEFGLETKDQSSLNMVDFITTDMSKPFSMFGKSDEVFRIKGGSSALIKALVAALENKIDMKQGYGLTTLDTKDGKIVVGFDAPGGVTSSENFDGVILALPFTKLRQVKGLENLKLGDDKLKCIHELGYGINAKILQGTTSRVWRSPELGLPAPSNGLFYSDLGFQNLSGTEPRPAGRCRHHHQLPRCKAWADRREVRTRRVPRRPTQDVAKDSRQYRPVCCRILVLGGLSLHARQLCQRQSGPIHHVVGGRTGAGSARPPAICRRAYERRLPRLYERWRAKRKPGLCRAYQNARTAQIGSGGTRGLLEPASGVAFLWRSAPRWTNLPRGLSGGCASCPKP